MRRSVSASWRGAGWSHWNASPRARPPAASSPCTRRCCVPLEVRHAATPPAEWDTLARAHGCFYHESTWITGLARTLGYRSHFLTAHDGATLVGGLALAEVPGLLGGHRLVSYPFSFVAGAFGSAPEARVLLA